MGDDAIGTMGLDVAPFERALNTVNAEMADLLIESKKLSAEMALLERQMFSAGGGTKAQANELKKLKEVSEDFTEQIKQAKEQQKAFSAATDQAIAPSEKLGFSLSRLTRAALGIGLGVESIYSLVRGFYTAKEAVDKLDESISNIGSTGGGAAEYKGLDELHKRLETINKDIAELGKDKGFLGNAFDAVRTRFIPSYLIDNDKKDRQAQELLDKRKETESEIAQKIQDQNEVLDLQLQNDKEAAELKKNELKYAELIGASEKGTNVAATEALKLEKQKTDELIKQVGARERQRAISAQAADEAKNAIGGVLGDQENEDRIKDREADKAQHALDFFHAREQKMAEGAEAYAAAEKKRLFALAKKQAEDAARAAIRTDINAVRQRGHGLDADELSVRQHFADQKSAAAGNPDLLAELEKQQAQALRDIKASEASQSPRQRIAEADRERRQSNLADRQTARENELRRRADVDPETGEQRGAHSKAIDALLEKDRLKKKQDAQVDRAKKDVEKGKNSTEVANGYLKEIRDALTAKD